MSIRIFILIITLTVNELSSPIKKIQTSEWVQKQDLYICYIQESHFRSRDTYRLKASSRNLQQHSISGEF